MPSKGGLWGDSHYLSQKNFVTCSFPNIYIPIYIGNVKNFQEKLIQLINTVFNKSSI